MVFFVIPAHHFTGFLFKAEWIYRDSTYFIINVLCALYRTSLYHEHACHSMCISRSRITNRTF